MDTVRVIKVVNNKITDVKSVNAGYTLKENEAFSEVGEVGQIGQDDGTFVDDTTPRPKPSISDLEAKINFIYLKQKGLL